MDTRNGGDGEALTSPAVTQPRADPTRGESDTKESPSNHMSAADDTSLSRGTSRASSTRNSTPAAASSMIRQSAQEPQDSPSVAEPVQPTQETAKVASGSERSPSKEDEIVAAPYGTRSRNRPGRSRPNYAEDAEMDFELTAAPTNGTTSDLPSRNSVAAENGQSSTGSGKKSTGAGQGNVSWGNSGTNPKDNAAIVNTPGTPATTATPPTKTAQQPPTKRRKNAATNATNGSLAKTATPSQAGAKRGNGNHATIVAPSARESNMLTFENTGAILTDGRLIADDGQTVSVNGKFTSPFSAAVCHHAGPAKSHGRFFAISNWVSFRPCVPRVRAARGALLSVQGHGFHPRRQRSTATRRVNAS